MEEQNKIQKAHSILATSRSITVLTGAGISAESGIPTYRDEDGLWSNFRAEDFSSAESFKQDPVKVWEWYKERRRTMAEAQPNDGHKALATMERNAMQFMMLTQNIDGLHQRAGTDNIVELHGSVWRLRCTNCLGEWEDRRGELPWLPYCESCHSLARPAVVWFGESLNEAQWTQAHRAAYCDTFLVVGTSALVAPVATLPEIAQKNRARIIEVNLSETPVSAIADVSIRGKAGDILPQLVEAKEHTIDGMHDMDLGRAMQRGLEKFYAKYPQLRKFVDGSGGKVE
jgi:NAD-dependent deacetylase